jgi:cytochrome c oxidase cbb3-type subunit 3
MKRAWILGVLAAAACAAQNARTNPLAQDKNAAEGGRTLFRIMCSPCHGIKAEGGRGPDLSLGVFRNGNTDGDLYEVIANGVPGTEMPGYGGPRLPEEDVWRLVSYVRSVARRAETNVPGNRQAGEKIFWAKGQCGQCHQVGTRGGKMGPDLTRAGRTRSLGYLRESIVDPSADITPGYATIRVVTRDGKTIAGVQRGLDNFSAQLVDTAGNFYSFRKDGVRSLKRELQSLMPSYKTSLSETELTDLVAYVASLQGEESR